MNKIKSLGQLFWSFFKIGALTFGGGLTMLPMLERELVDRRNWVTEEELLDCYAIGQCTPGIIAVNTATFVGYKREKVPGGIIATLGMVCPSILIITVVALFLRNFMDNVWFGHAIMGIRGVVCALLVNTVINLGKKSLKSIFAWIVCAVVFVLAFFTKLPTVIIVILAAVSGIVMMLIKTKKDKSKELKGENKNE
ncbi:MAG: chromate transporter [Treponema sp.]|nr:chromate transporter [Treponema sp.]MDY5124272.1 chromate transporter [Treponema sp.]